MTKVCLPDEDTTDENIGEVLAKVLSRLSTEHKFDHLDSSREFNCFFVADGENKKLFVVYLVHRREEVYSHGANTFGVPAFYETNETILYSLRLASFIYL
jgi:hypothetical protein